MTNPHLPVETLDNIVDYLHDAKYALRNCCLVSKSWVPRTRKHLFSDINFSTKERLGLWKETFPDPSTSPAHYTKSLTVGCSHVVTAADAEVGGWITGFPNVVHFWIGSMELLACGFKVTFVPFHGFSSRIKSLRACFPFLLSSQIFHLALSFPLLEDLAVIALSEVFGDKGEDSNWLSTAAQPPFTGSLELQRASIKPITPRLLSLPGGIHFRKLTLWCADEEHLLWTTGLVAGCSSTLESLSIKYDLHGKSIWRLCPHWSHLSPRRGEANLG